MSIQHSFQGSNNFCCQVLLDAAELNRIPLLRQIERKGLDIEEVYANLIAELLEVRASSRITEPRAYVFAVLRNIIAQECEARSFKRALLDDYDDDSLKCHQQIEAEGYRQYMQSESLKMHLADLQVGLATEVSSYELKVLKMYYIEKKSFSEISSHFGKNEDAVRKAASRGRQKLKIFLKAG